MKEEMGKDVHIKRLEEVLFLSEQQRELLDKSGEQFRSGASDVGEREN